MNDFISLSKAFPEIASEANGWDPSTVSPGSGRKLSWRCQAGHTWEAVVINRTARNSGCPICSGRKVLAGFNDLQTKFPLLAQQSNGWDPTEYSPGSNKKVSWKCADGHEWEATIANRTGRGDGCPVCSGQKIVSGINDLLTLNPKIAKEAFGWDPSTVALHSNQKVKWKCQKGHIWESTVTNRSRRNDGCAVCSSHKTLAGFNDLLTTEPDIASEAFGWDPTQFSRSSNKKKSWKCEEGHIYDAVIHARTAGSGCPVCAGKKVQIGFNDLMTLNPKLAAEANGWDPRNYSKSSNELVSWVCSKGHVWESTINNRSRGSGCPVCSHQRVASGVNDLATTHPELALEAYGWDPTEFVAGSTRENLDWQCKLGHIWKSTVARRSSGSKCPVCVGQKVHEGFNDLLTTHPELAAEAHGWDPRTVMAGTDKTLDWKCSKGHIFLARGADRKAGSQCPICLGQQVLIGFNDLATTHPELATEAFGWNPKTLTAGSGKKRQWKCEEGHIWETVVGHRTGESPTGCPTCSRTGFDPNKDGWIYFLIHEDWEMLQIGITNVPDDRLSRHSRLGWKVIELRGPMDGLMAQNWETSILRMLKAKKADLSNRKIAGKFDGYSEAWSKSTFEASSIKELMELTEDFEEGRK
jgi:hypothetical protein